MLALIAPLMILLAGSGDPLYGEGDYCVPKDVKTYQIYEGGESKGFGGVRYWGEDGWLNENRPKVEEMRQHKSQAEIVFDRPWSPARPERITLTSSFRFDLEMQTDRKARLKQGWKNAGYVSEGGIYILEKELAKVQQALALANRPAEEAPMPVLKGSDVIEGAATPGLVRQFWLHGLILVGGLGVLSVLVKLYFLP